MGAENLEIYRPRAVSDLGVWTAGLLRLKAYGLVADGRTITDDMVSEARGVLRNVVVGQVVEEGASNDLGFVIVHPGDLGLSISAHWWVQGSVLCQHFHRRLYTSDVPLEATRRPVIGCVWELAIVDAERRAWRETMMTAMPDPQTYLDARGGLESV